MSIKIEVDLATLGFEQDPESGEIYATGETLEERVVESITSRLLNTYATESISGKVEERVDRYLDGIVKERVLGILNGVIVKHDSYTGKPLDEPTTIEQLTMQSFNKWISAPQSNSDFSRNRNTLGELLEKQVADLLAKELKPTIDAAKVEIRRVVIDKAVRGAVEALTPKVIAS
jgi:hypothetical protein